jgi:hypothetical protein
MKVIIAGSRHITDKRDVCDAVNHSGFEITEVVSGGAPGVDSIGEELAATFGIPLKRFPAKWKEHGKAAGPIRNEQMAQYADALVLVWDGRSKGSANILANAKARNLQIHECIVQEIRS